MGAYPTAQIGKREMAGPYILQWRLRVSSASRVCHIPRERTLCLGEEVAV